jgi:Mg2+ and Co2+ transporter CorA
MTNGIGVRLVGGGRVEQHPLDELELLVARQDGLVWVDIPDCDEEGVRVLSEVFGFHPLAVRDCVQRNDVPKFHAYADHVFVVLQALGRGEHGGIHTIELDQFVGPGFLVTVHGPGHDRADGLSETEAVLRRIEAGRLDPGSSFELSHAIVSAMAGHQERLVATLTQEAWRLEQRVMLEELPDPEQFLEQLFQARQELLRMRTTTMLSREIYARMATLSRFVPGDSQRHVADIVDQFERLTAMAGAQKEYLEGVIELYRTRTETKMTIAAERLAVIAVVTLPITALSSIYGMNIIVNDRTDFPHLAVVLTIMAIISGTLLRWAKRQGWW